MAGTTNFLQFNPTQANQESDSAYATDTTRVNGAGVGSIWPSASANKLLYQLSTGMTALMQMLANKGTSTSDSNLGALTTAMAALLTTADIKPSMVSVPYAATLVLDASVSNGFQVVLTGNVSSLTLINIAAYQPITLAFTQDGTGSRTVAFTTVFKGVGTIDPAANLTSMQKFMVLGDALPHADGPMVVT